MKVLGNFTESINGIVCDIDNTVYVRTGQYLQEGSDNEITGIAKVFGWSFEWTQERVKTRRQELVDELGRSATLTETVYDLGVTPEQWSDLRIVAWNPEKYVECDSAMSCLFEQLSLRYRVAFGTNSPLAVGRRILSIVGIKNQFCFGPENLGCSKPDPDFYIEIAKKIGVEPARCVSIGDREMSEGPSALAAGYAGAIIVPGSRDELLSIGPQLISGDFKSLAETEVLCHAV